MDNQLEIGGAQALLQLGLKEKSKMKKEKARRKKTRESKKADVEEHLDPGEHGQHLVHADDSEVHDGHTEAHVPLVGEGVEEDDSKATNQQINDAVEAAVMRYVGGNLESEEKKNGKRKLNADELITSISDFQQWSGYLDDGELEYYEKNTPKKKKKRALSHEIDPELSGLDNSEHDQLVRAAILETRELAKQLGSTYNSLSNLPPQQVQQIIAAVQNYSNNDTVSTMNHISQMGKEHRNTSKEIDLKQGDASHEKDFSRIHTIEELSEEAKKVALSWYKQQPELKGPRPFSQEERNAVEYFIDGYSFLNKMDRKGVCNRIWTTERKKDNFWECLTKVLPYRSRASVYKHVRRQYHVFDVRAKWTPEDDENLRRLAATKTGNWKEIGSLMGRMPEDCRDRWRNYIKCGDNRLLSKWSTEEEDKLKDVVTNMLTRLGLSTINWTLVSEAMDGTRSRIQCRYKWNKLVKKESIARTEFMDIDTQLWFFQKLKSLGYSDIKEVDWQLISRLCQEELGGEQRWLPSDFEFGFEKMRTVIKDNKKYDFQPLMDQLVEDARHQKFLSKDRLPVPFMLREQPLWK